MAEERHEHAFAAARVLVGREPQQPALLEVLQRRAQLVAGEHGAGVAQAAALHRPLHRALVVRAVHAGQRRVVAHQAGRDLQRGEVARHDDHATPAGLRRLQVFQSLHPDAAAHRRHAAPPGACELEQADAQFAEVGARQRLLARRVQLREAQGDVAPGHVSAVAQQPVQQGADGAAQRALQAPRDARGQPCQTDAQPRGPLPRCHGRTLAGVGGSLLGFGHGPL